MNDIITTIVFDTTTGDGYPLQFRYNGSLTINVFTGLREKDYGPLEDEVEIDVMTISEPSMAHARDAVQEWLTRDTAEIPEGCGKWGCRDCYPDEE